MGTINTFEELQSRLAGGTRSDTFVYFSGNVGLSYTGWISPYGRFTPGAVVPTAYVALNASTPGAVISIPASSSKQLWLAEMEFAGQSATPATRFSAILYDRLVHGAGLVGNVTGEQTTNFPTAALPRYTDGEGVIPFLEVYTSISTVNTTCWIRYTNQAGVPNRISSIIAVLSNQNSAADSITPFPLADGDTGCRSVEGFTMAAASALAGNMGITLMKKIATFPVDTGSYVERQGYRQLLFNGGIVEIKPDAFLMPLISTSQNTTGQWNMMGRVGIVEK